jgi:hypothetical protein
MQTNRPMFSSSGEQVIAGILAGDPVAIDEASHRGSKAVKAALAGHTPAPVETVAQTAAKSRSKAVKAGAQKAFDKAAAAAKDGERVKAGIKARAKYLARYAK